MEMKIILLINFKYLIAQTLRRFSPMFFRIIDAGGFYLNQVRLTNTDQIVMPQVHILPNNLTLVRVGKKNFYIIEWTF